MRRPVNQIINLKKFRPFREGLMGAISPIQRDITIGTTSLKFCNASSIDCMPSHIEDPCSQGLTQMASRSSENCSSSCHCDLNCEVHLSNLSLDDPPEESTSCGGPSTSSNSTPLHSPISDKLCKTLTHIDLSGQDLECLPRLDDVPSLLTLNISDNKFNQLPSELKSAVRLRELDVSRNKLSQFPQLLIESLVMIKKLSLSFNSLGTLPKPSCVQHLEELNVRSCQIKKFPEWALFERHRLAILDLSQNPVFSSFALNERALFHSSVQLLKKLNLSNTYFNDQSKRVILHFTNLEELDVSNYGLAFTNRFEALEAGLPQSLKILRAQNVGIGSSPALKGSRLSEVDVARNPMSWIDPNFVARTLKVLALPHCSICFLPDNIGEMLLLEWLDLSYNDINELPTSLNSLSRLKYLDLYSNSLTSFPKDLLLCDSLMSLDVCYNCFDPPVHPLGTNRPSYEDLKTSLRAQLSDHRKCGSRPKPSDLDEDVVNEPNNYVRMRRYCDSSSSESYLDEDNETNSAWQCSVDSAPQLPQSKLEDEEENWDCPQNDKIYESEVSGLSLDCPLGPSYVGSDSNMFFCQYLHLVPQRIRQSPFYYHRIDLTSQVLSPAPSEDIVEGQFDD